MTTCKKYHQNSILASLSPQQLLLDGGQPHSHLFFKARNRLILLELLFAGYRLRLSVHGLLDFFDWIFSGQLLLYLAS